MRDLIWLCRLPMGPMHLCPSYHLAIRVLSDKASIEQVLTYFEEGPLPIFMQQHYLLFLAYLLGKPVNNIDNIGPSIPERITRLIEGPLPLINEVEGQLIRFLRKYRIVNFNPQIRPIVYEKMAQLNEKERAAESISVEGIIAPHERLMWLEIFPSLTKLSIDELYKAKRLFEVLEKRINEDYTKIRQTLPPNEELLDFLDSCGLWEPQVRRNILKNLLGSDDGRIGLLPTGFKFWLTEELDASKWFIPTDGDRCCLME